MNRKILFITSSLSKGGAETQLIKLATFLKTRDNDILIVSLLPKSDLDIQIPEPGIKVVYLKTWRWNLLLNLRQLHRSIKDFNPEVVIAFMFIAIIVARLLKLLFDFTLVSSIRAAEIPRKWYIPFKFTSALDDVVVYNADSSKLSFENQGLVKKEGVVINNAISIPTSSGHDFLEFENKPFVWVCVAHFRIEKDYLTLFKALGLLKNKNFRINIIGHLFDQQWPFKVVEQLKIQDKVNLMGFKSNATDYLQESDAFVVSSFTESMPNAILEAMANEKPIVATAVGGVTDLINASKSGFCYKLGDEYELASRMSDVMNMSDRQRTLLGQNGRKYVESNFSEAIVMEKWMHVIDQYSDIKKPKEQSTKILAEAARA